MCEIQGDILVLPCLEVVDSRRILNGDPHNSDGQCPHPLEGIGIACAALSLAISPRRGCFCGAASCHTSE